MPALRYWPGIVGVLGIWLIVSPFLLGYSGSLPALWNSIVVGLILVATALYGYYYAPGGRPVWPK